MQLSARNVLKGKVQSIIKGQTTAHVKVTVGNALISASITMEAVSDLNLKEGDDVITIIKASDVIIGKE